MEKPYKVYQSHDEAAADYDNYKNDWKIFPRAYTAVHKSGVEMEVGGTYQQDGQEHIKIHCKFNIGNPELPDLDQHEFDKYLDYLHAQFLILYEKAMPKFKVKQRTEAERRKSMERSDKERLKLMRDYGMPEEVINQWEEYFKKTLIERFNMGNKR